MSTEADLTSLAGIALAVPVAVLLFWNAKRTHEFGAIYRYDGDFRGERHPCEVMFSHFESGTPCLIGANGYGVYLLNDPAKGGRKRTGPSIFPDLCFPWADLEVSAAFVWFRRRIWFQVRNPAIAFHVPAEIGAKVLADGGKTLPGPE